MTPEFASTLESSGAKPRKLQKCKRAGGSNKTNWRSQ
jgi:hypothetical protein